jgi:hypothetical protein
MAELNGTRVLAPIVPPDSNDNFPTHIANYGKGNIHSTIDLTERDNIPVERRLEGMLCYVTSVARTFQLKGGVDNFNWQELQAAGSGGSGGGTGDMSQYMYDTNSDGKVNSADTADVALTANSVAFANITGKPATYPAEAHGHLATDITTDAAKMFVSQTEKNTWNSKADILNTYTKTETDNKIAAVIGTATPALLDTLKEFATAIGDDPNYAATTLTALGNKVDKIAGKGLSANDFDNTYKTKLDNLTNYVAPSSYPATMIQTDMNHEFVTDAQIATWNNKQTALGFTPENFANKAVANGYASLDGTGKVPLSQIPAMGFNTGSVVTDTAARASITGMKTGDLSYETSTGDTYIYDGSTWKLMADKDWANLNVDWASIVNKPTSTVASIDSAVLNSHSHTNKAILDLTQEAFTTTLKNKIGDADSLVGLPIDLTGATNGYSFIYSNGTVKLAAIAGGGGGAGTGDMLISVYDANGDGIVDVAESANSVTWANVTGKPASFPIANHKSTHITGGSDAISPADIGAADATTTAAHISNMSNPHNTTKTQIGLSNVTNDSQVKRSEMGLASGVATLDTGGKVPISQLPAMAINNTFVVATEAAMLGLSTSIQGDIAIRTDVSKSFILQSVPAATLANWQELLAPVGTGIQSVNGQTGTAVTITTTNVSEGTNLYFTDARVSSNPTVSAHVSNTSNPHATTKAQIGLTNVTNDAQVKRTEMGAINGVATLDSSGTIPLSQIPSGIGGGGGAITSVNSKVGVVVLNTSDIAESTNLYYTDVRVDARISASSTIGTMSTHISNVSNPHTVTKAQIGLANVTNDAQVKRSEMAVANGVATLDATGKIPTSQIPALGINNTFVVSDQAAMLSLSTAVKGDLAIRTDLNKSFILSATPYSSIGNWQELLAPTGSGVTTVNGQAGPSVTLTSTNIAEGTKLYYTDARVAAAPALTSHIGNTSNPHSVTKTQVGLANVDNVQQIPMSQKGVASGVATLGTDGKVPASQLPAATGGGGGSTISRYEATGSTGGQCIVTATGAGATIVLTPGNAVLSAPAGVEILSAKIYVSASNIPSTSFNVNYGQNVGMGDNTTYNTAMFPSMAVVIESSKVFKNAGTFNYAAGTNIATVTGLSAGQSFWLKLVF